MGGCSIAEVGSVDDELLQQYIYKNSNRILTYPTQMRQHFFLQLLPAKTLRARTDKCMGGKSSKNHIAVLICSDKWDLLIFGTPNTTAKLQPIDKGATAKFKVHYRQQATERLINFRTAGNAADLKVYLGKAVFARGIWRDVKRQIILKCIK